MNAKTDDMVGRIFSVPLLRGGYAFGYVTYRNKATMALCDVFDTIADSPDIPEAIENKPLVLRDYMIGGAEFIDTSRMKVKLPYWKLSNRRMSHLVLPHNKFFIMGSPGFYKIVDIFDKTYKRMASEEEIRKFPHMQFPFPPMTTKVLEKHVRHLDIDPKEI